MADSNFANTDQDGNDNDLLVTQGPGKENAAGTAALAVRQHGDLNALTILQSGNRNEVGTRGSGFLQSVNRNSATITQSSDDNVVGQVTQTGILSSTGGNALRRNILEVLQETGDGNVIGSVTQIRAGWATGAASNSAELRQTGANNEITSVIQSGYDQSLRLQQVGDGNQVASSEQRGSRNRIDIRLDGNRNGVADFVAAPDIGGWGALAEGHVYQNNDSLLASPFDGNEIGLVVTGSDNSFGFRQLGGANLVDGVIIGDGNQTGVNQLGAQNVAGFTLTGEGNLLFIDQGLWAINYGNEADVLVTGDRNQVGARQGGSNNVAKVTIGGAAASDDNVVSLLQESLLWGNEAEIDIDGSRNRISLEQTGRNSALVSVTGDDNRLSGTQSGSLNTLDIGIIGNNNNAGAAFDGVALTTAQLISPTLTPGSIVQNGTGNSIFYRVGLLAPSDDNRFAFSQEGNGNRIEGRTEGSSNQVVIVQHGNLNFAWFSQTGFGNVIGVSQ